MSRTRSGGPSLVRTGTKVPGPVTESASTVCGVRLTSASATKAALRMPARPTMTAYRRGAMLDVITAPAEVTPERA